MSSLSCKIGSRHYTFAGLRDLMAKATPARSGDTLAGIAAQSAEERVAAQMLLRDVPLKRFLEEPLIPYEDDEVTRLIIDSHDPEAFAPVANLTVGEFREWLLRYETDDAALTKVAPGLTPEMVAAASKIMRNQDLILVAAKRRVVTKFRNTLGLPGRLSVRLQPNHPTDDPKGIIASVLDGLLMGCGDAVIGINPVTDSVANTVQLLTMLDELIRAYNIPTQSCVLAHVTNQVTAIERGAPIDLVFQSVAGTEAANRSFGIDLKLLHEARDAALSLKRGSVGTNVMYFETGQGSALSANAHHGVDQQTCEARAYAVARAFDPLLVNTVVGFIGPEYLFDGKQILRAGLEDHFCGKMLGLPMGCDICYTNHAEADQDDMDTLLTLLCAAGVNYIMGVPGADDIMLNYQSTSFHDSQYARQVFGLRPAPEFEEWLRKVKVIDRKNRLRDVTKRHALASGKPVHGLLESGGGKAVTARPAGAPGQYIKQFTSARVYVGRAGGSLPTDETLDFRLAHARARDAVHAEFDAQQLQGDLQSAGFRCIVINSAAADKSLYLQNPGFGRSISEADRDAVAVLAEPGGCDVGLIVSDGLSATAAHRQVLPLVRQLYPLLRERGLSVSPVIIVHRGRVAIEDAIGQLLRARAAVILIGERPGLGSPDSLGAYLVFDPQPGKTDAERNCISNIRPEGLAPEAAAHMLSELILQSLRQQLSGVALKVDLPVAIGK